MSLQFRLAALITAIGADIKALQNSGGKSGLVAAMPPATNATKGWLYTATDQGVTYANLDGSNWIRWAADAPIGGLEEFGGFTLPSGWLEADGAALNRASYPRLFNAITRTFSGSTVAAPAAGANVITNVLSTSLTHIGIGCTIEGPGIPVATVVIGLSADSGGFRNLTLSKNATATNSGASFRALPYGGSDGAVNFNLPDFRGRVTVASGANAGLTERKLGQKDGEETHQLTVAEMPAHNHQQILGWNAGPYTLPYWDGNTGRSMYGDSGGTGGVGGNGFHNNMQPFNVARKIIKVY